MEAGTTNYDGDTVPGRRVVLPWGSSSFSINSLNANGQTILQRSLNWAGSTWSGPVPGVMVSYKFEVKDSGYVDGYDSTEGSYGGGNVSSDATVGTNNDDDERIKVDGGEIRGAAYIPEGSDPNDVIEIKSGGSITGGSEFLSGSVPIPSTPAPTGLRNRGNKTFSSNGSINSSRRYRKLKIEDNAVVTVYGNVTVLCTDDVKFEDNAQLVLAPGATLTMYTRDKVDIKDNARVNQNGDPTSLTWICPSDEIKLDDDAQMTACVEAVNGELEVKDRADFYGTFIGRKVKIEDYGAFHADTANSGTTSTMGGVIDLTEVSGKRIRWLELP